MAKNYSYPRVTMSTVAKKHSHNRVNVPDTTIMFAPLVTEKGPDDRLIKVHSLEEFISTFGSLDKDFYELNGQMALNVYNWLNNGGTLFVKRLVVSEEKAAYNKKVEKKTSETEEETSVDKIVSLEIELNSKENKNVFDSSQLSEKELLEKLLGRDSIFILNNLNTIKMDKNHVIDLGTLSASEYGRAVKENEEAKEFYFYIKEKENTATTENTVEASKTYELVLTPNKLTTVDIEDENGVVYTFKEENKTYEPPVTDANPVKPLTNEEILDIAETMENTKIFIENGNYIVKKLTSTSSDTEITVATLTATDIVFSIQAKYHGDYYNNLWFVIEPCATKEYFNFKIYKDSVSGLPLEQFLAVKTTKALADLSSSEYIEVLNGENFVKFLGAVPEDGDNIEYKLVGNTHTKTYSDILNVLRKFWIDDDKKGVKTLLANRLETPIDILFDAGYPSDIKEEMYKLVSNHGDNPLRPDIILILDKFVLNEKLRLNAPSEAVNVINGKKEPFEEEFNVDTTNVAYYEQYFTVNEPTFADQDIYVTPTYFLSKLIIYNDLTYGMQYPTAGLRRGLLEDAIWMNTNPDAATKEDWFQKRHNYAEKTSRETAFMSQRVVDGSNDYDYTALSFLNNNRVLEKMKKELEFIGRSYLHEFNDAITIANMSVALNKYVANWIANRTLSLGTVEVVQNEVSENALDINLTIKFTNTIEVINVSIVIE